VFGETRADLIARTETSTAFNLGTIQALKDAGEDYVVVSDPDECGEDVCDVDGETWTIEEAEAEPIGHPNAVMAGTRVLAVGGVREAWRSRWHGPLARFRTAAGHDLSIGPNHPVLTTRGFVPAKLLRVGDHVVRRVRRDDAGNTVAEPDLKNVEAVVEQVFDALSAVALSSRITAAPTYFHGDGNFCEGDVDVVRPRRLLKRVGDAALVQEAREGELMLTRSELEAFACGSAEAFDAPAVALASAGGVRRGHITRVRLPGTDGDAAFGEAGAEGGVADTSLRRECERRLALEVTLDEIVEVGDVASYVGHAFDLRTESGFYFADGLIVSNCGRDFRPLTEDELAEVRAEEGEPEEEGVGGFSVFLLDRIARLEALVERRERFYSEDEERDYHGRWTKGGGEEKPSESVKPAPFKRMSELTEEQARIRREQNAARSKAFVALDHGVIPKDTEWSDALRIVDEAFQNTP
jgi:hypothetical protein